jgi:hypothetical protein
MIIILLKQSFAATSPTANTVLLLSWAALQPADATQDTHVSFGAYCQRIACIGVCAYAVAGVLTCWLLLVAGKGNVKIWGTQPKSIDDAEDRDKWYEILTKLDIKQPPGGMCTDEASALNQSKKLGFPVMVRPSFVLGGRAMEIVYRYGRHTRSF